MAKREGIGGPKIDDTVAKAPALSQKVEEVVDRWFSDNFHNSVVSRDTTVFNLIHAAKPALKKALADALGQTSE